MKRLIAMLMLAACSALGAEQHFYQNAYFHTNVYFYDDTNTTVLTRFGSLLTNAVVSTNAVITQPLKILTGNDDASNAVVIEATTETSLGCWPRIRFNTFYVNHVNTATNWLDLTNSTFSFSAPVSAPNFVGNGSGLTNLNRWIFVNYAPSNSSATASNRTIAASGGNLYICASNNWGGAGTNWLKVTGAAF